MTITATINSISFVSAFNLQSHISRFYSFTRVASDFGEVIPVLHWEFLIFLLINLLLFLSARYGKYGVMIGLEVLTTGFVQPRIARRQAKS